MYTNVTPAVRLCTSAVDSVVVGGFEGSGEVRREGPAVGREVMLGRPADGGWVGTGQAEHVGSEHVVAEVEADPAGEAAALGPAGRHVPSGHGAGNGCDNTAVGTEPR